ncbi:undecaprenyl/decaprenyl-phosphate alpha-N-acetylglucosaminyl 1-phosphate transferase [Virgibacillus halodenitrificans]|uniref:Undecaprenyl/decaprenyl-phosphate alpha-N-acetylglucosaminyl 1-phosphate transferase n=1 Tax=Virgibacillus halodenitrificans TaxID=1482 RepID=A0ABR7VI76_VIRHA|nr:MraY family glycosyltransferase [Virgibacillus halodenitrificans]MBD1221393.1 undecaprenyl/decaprenyl-phosphate alpha-N-acetylglucosaminyl 1-phosphate transferase [Virgibacillus halodenitrificans]MCJ0929633.1 undecaprenyl/decaprenyl-phosphate alpha-N-acetylglucosaminyl 1-phosphate transferase [Virgibacillus halodenitrificans]MEC2158543.1 MraY family glycosyltransferase [Virgibacillus halodenitrificans]MYL47370.1 undecaprenyl/decaprenyl-phosphate alpha-N-acetylglucosaminyl 1-phosphate transfe
MVILAFLTTLISLIITPIVIKYAKKLNATDKPNYRKVHKDPIPTLGGLAIFMSFLIGLVILQPVSEYHLAIVIGGFIMIILGFFDDLFDLSPKVKFLTQILAASLVVFWGGLQVEFINLPFGGQIEFGILSSVITIIWIAGVTNAINFIDGLDGLAAGVSSIALMTIAVMAIIMGNVYVATMALILFFSTMGFLRYNFNPAKIFMGDTGALFLGFMISVLALLGFKNVTIISFIIPIFILGVPISDTLIAMVRRYINKQPLSSPDSSHLHHRLVKFGLTHKQTVLFIYALSAMFSLAAILFSMTTVWGSILIFTIAMLAVQALIENLELINSEYKPLTNLLKGMRQKP